MGISLLTRQLYLHPLIRASRKREPVPRLPKLRLQPSGRERDRAAVETERIIERASGVRDEKGKRRERKDQKTGMDMNKESHG